MTTQPQPADEQPTPELPLKGIDQEALQRLNAEIEAKAEQQAAAGRPTAEPLLQPETADPLEILNPELSRALARLRVHLEANPRPAAPEPQPAPEPTAKLIQLDFWEDGRRAAPNIVFRSALFPALNTKQERRYLDQERIFTTKGGEIYFTGKQFDQSDLDVYLEILNFARPFPLGTLVRFSAYSMLKALGRNTGKSDHQWLHSVLIRLCGGVIDMTDHKKRYAGGLIHDFIKDEITAHYEITINPKFAILFGYGMWSTLDKAQRQALKQNQTAKALHAYYASHAAPGPHDYETLAEVAGLKGKNRRDVKAAIIKAHEAMKQIGFMSAYEAEAKTITAKINHTPGQAHHIVKKIIKNRKPKKGTG
jgi:hypothetical protein